ncbi:MAG: hypothetical protein ACREMR_06635 [Gemmatimonadales bacterium]
MPPEEQCFFCGGRLVICETQERYVQTLPTLWHVVGRGKKCVAPQCAHGTLRYRSPEVGRLVLKGHEFGRDVVLWVGDQYFREHVSIPRLHRRLVGEFSVPICERSVGNLLRDYEALCQCVAGDSDRVRAKLKRQGGLVLCVDGVHFDEGSPVLYVQRDALSGEVLYAERRLARGKDALVPMLRRTAELAAEIDVPIIGIVSDKETSLVPAIAEAFPGRPHQFCQTHYLKNVAVPLQADDQALARAAAETVTTLRDVQRTIERRFPAVAAGQEAPTAPAAPTAQNGAGPAEGTRAAELDGTAEIGAVPDDSALAEARVAAALARAGATAGIVCGRPITDPPGLKRVQRLWEVWDAVDQAAQKKGLHRPAGP